MLFWLLQSARPKIELSNPEHYSLTDVHIFVKKYPLFFSELDLNCLVLFFDWIAFAPLWIYLIWWLVFEAFANKYLAVLTSNLWFVRLLTILGLQLSHDRQITNVMKSLSKYLVLLKMCCFYLRPKQKWSKGLWAQIHFKTIHLLLQEFVICQTTKFFGNLFALPSFHFCQFSLAI